MPGPASQVIAFEGVDGTGKSTVLGLVAAQLRAAGVSVCLPRVGKRHGSRPARAIRSLARDRTNLALDARAELLLYAAREAQVLDEDVRAAIARGDTVLLDRSLLTPLVLGVHGRGLAMDSCEMVTRAAAGGLQPDRTLIFDVDPRTSWIRKLLDKVRRDRFRDAGRKGLAGSAFKHRVRAGYLELAARDRLPVFHTERSAAADVAARVLALLEHGRLDEPARDRVPWWIVDPRASFDEALAQLPALLQLAFTRERARGRELRAGLLDTEPALAIWACDLQDPLLDHAATAHPILVLRRLAGLRRADALRRRLEQTEPAAVARSLVGLASADDDALRQRLADTAPGAVVESLAGRDDAFALALRERLWTAADIHERALSLRGCRDPSAWPRREQLLDEDPAAVIPTLTALEPGRVEPILRRHAARAPKPVIRALLGRGDDQAHALREDLLETGAEVIDSLAGLDDARAWDLRERCVERWPASVAASLVGLGQRPRTPAMIERCREVGADDLFTRRNLELLDALVCARSR